MLNPSQTYSPDSLQRWTKSLFDGISVKHPGFYSYTPKANFDRLIDSTMQTMEEPLTELEYYRKIKPLFAQIGCLHTEVSLSAAYQQYLNGAVAFIPIDVFVSADGKVFVAKNYDASSGLHSGEQLIAINNRPIGDIIETLLNAIPSDGFNRTEKILVLNHRFPFWYQTMIESSARFTVEVEEDGARETYELQGVSKEVFPSDPWLAAGYEKPFELEIRDSVGILKVHSFAKSVIKASDQRFSRFVKGAFKQIKEAGVETLIVDLRYNTGGTDTNAVLLASYFFDQPFRYWDRIEVTPAIAAEIKGVNRLFYRKPIEVDGTYRWRKTWVTSEFDYYQPQKPSKANFTGNTYLLTNGLCTSSCADFAAILSHNNKATIVGTETGGGFQGNNSGLMPVANTPTGLRVTVPLQKYTNAVDLTKHFGQGTLPDFEVSPTFADWVKERDVEMEFVQQLIREE